jgi:Tol biopolymer transport system component
VGGQGTIWASDSAGGNLRQLTTEGLEEFDPWNQSWSPDGSEFAYLSRHTGTADIWVMPVNGGPARQLTKDLRDDTQPVWSPDGRWVAFLSTRVQQTDLWVAPSTGGDAIRVTDDAAEESRLQWVGPGTRLGFQTSSASGTLWALDADAGTERQVTPDSIRVGGFRVSPDGSQVAYVVERGGGVTDLQVVPLAGGPPRVLVAGSHENRLGEWSPDGQTILYESNRGGNVDLWTVSAAGGAPTQLTKWPTYETSPAWTTDGSGISSCRRDATLRDIWLVRPPATARRITTVAASTPSPELLGPDLFVILLGGRARQFVLAGSGTAASGPLGPEQRRQRVARCRDARRRLGRHQYRPSGGRDEGFLISTRTGQGRQLLGKGQAGRRLLPRRQHAGYTFQGDQDLGILDMKDGTTQRLTNTRSESGYWWAE